MSATVRCFLVALVLTISPGIALFIIHFTR